MSPGVAAAVAGGLGAVASALATLAVLVVRASTRYHRVPGGFRCRVLRPGAGGWRARRRPTRAAWVGDVLLVREGFLRLWVEPLSVALETGAVLRSPGPAAVRGLGAHPVTLRFSLLGPGGMPTGDLEVAVAAEDADRLVGPFLTAALPRLPDAPREHGG